MREIKFRGKRVDNGNWVYGNVFYPDRLLKGVWICPDINFCDFYPDQDEDKFDPDAEHKGITIGRFLEVNPESVGQFTGLKDRNGKDIYEFDYVLDKHNKRILVKYEFPLLSRLKEIEKELLLDGNLYK